MECLLIQIAEKIHFDAVIESIIVKLWHKIIQEGLTFRKMNQLMFMYEESIVTDEWEIDCKDQ